MGLSPASINVVLKFSAPRILQSPAPQPRCFLAPRAPSAPAHLPTLGPSRRRPAPPATHGSRRTLRKATWARLGRTRCQGLQGRGVAHRRCALPGREAGPGAGETDGSLAGSSGGVGWPTALPFSCIHRFYVYLRIFCTTAYCREINCCFEAGIWARRAAAEPDLSLAGQAREERDAVADRGPNQGR